MNRIFLLPALLCLYLCTHAQEGVYKSADDFINGELSYMPDGAGKHAIRTDIPFNASAVKVVSGGETIRLSKSDLYGYRNSKNQLFRFFNNGSYRIISQQQFPLYSRQVNVWKGKAKTRETKYYFSKDEDAPVMALTVSNLKYAFPMSRAFHELLDLHFRSDRELLRYDSFYKEYTLNALFVKTVQ